MASLETTALLDLKDGLCFCYSTRWDFSGSVPIPLLTYLLTKPWTSTLAAT